MNNQYIDQGNVSQDVVLQKNGIEINSLPEKKSSKVFLVIFLIISLGTFIPPWLFILIFGASMERPSSQDSFLLLLSFLIPLTSLITGISLGIKKKNALWFVFPHLVAIIWFILMFSLAV